MEIIQLSWLQLAIGFIILIIPGAILWWYNTGLNKENGDCNHPHDPAASVCRLLSGILFEYDNTWLNLAWIMVMVVVADFATIDRSGLKATRSLVLPIFGATFLGNCSHQCIFS